MLVVAALDGESSGGMVTLDGYGWFSSLQPSPS
jgi:hypothetical protein